MPESCDVEAEHKVTARDGAFVADGPVTEDFLPSGAFASRYLIWLDLTVRAIALVCVGIVLTAGACRLNKSKGRNCDELELGARVQGYDAQELVEPLFGTWQGELIGKPEAPPTSS